MAKIARERDGRDCKSSRCFAHGHDVWTMDGKRAVRCTCLHPRLTTASHAAINCDATYVPRDPVCCTRSLRVVGRRDLRMVGVSRWQRASRMDRVDRRDFLRGAARPSRLVCARAPSLDRRHSRADCDRDLQLHRVRNSGERKSRRVLHDHCVGPHYVSLQHGDRSGGAHHAFLWIRSRRVRSTYSGDLSHSRRCCDSALRANRT